MGKVKHLNEEQHDEPSTYVLRSKTTSKNSLQDANSQISVAYSVRSKQSIASSKTYGNGDQVEEKQKQIKKIRPSKKKVKTSTTGIRNYKELREKEEKKRGLIYIGHLPHGFYEEELRNYFKQFGKVTNVKVCRSRISGNSKGYGYVEFQHPDVAKIAADAMNNYVMFKKRIVTEFVPYEKRPKALFQGKSSNKQHTSVKTRQNKQKHTKNKEKNDKTILKKTKKVYKKFQNKLTKLNNLGVQCNLLPADLNSQLLEKVKLERKSDPNTSSSEEGVLINVKQSPKSSLVKINSNKLILTKSLDSVKTILSKSSQNSQDEQTQTVQSTNKKRVLKGGVTKAKKANKKKFEINNETVQRIARELIRKRGNPLLNLRTTIKQKNKK